MSALKAESYFFYLFPEISFFRLYRQDIYLQKKGHVSIFYNEE
jgi:hypothetical protein